MRNDVIVYAGVVSVKGYDEYKLRWYRDFALNNEGY